MKLKAVWLAFGMVAFAFGQDPSSTTSQATSPGNSGTTAETKDALTSDSQARKEGQRPSEYGTSDTRDVADLLAPGPLPQNRKLSLIGGAVVNLDRIRNRMDVRVFGGKKMRVNFDERSHIYRDGVETTSLGINKGDRVYLDTMLNGSQIFAKAIHVDTRLAQADVEGQLISVDRNKKEITLRDKISEQPVTVALSAATKIENQGTASSSTSLEPGALVKIRFAGRGGARPEAVDIYILADPGATYTFYGEVSYIDKNQNLMAIRNATGDKFYDISVEETGIPTDLRVGSTAKVTARFNGTRYQASNIAIEPSQQSTGIDPSAQRDSAQSNNQRK